MIQWTPDLIQARRREFTGGLWNAQTGHGTNQMRLMELYLDVLEYIGVECDALSPQQIADLCAACYVPV
mgnify:CR=1 FL=1